MVTEAYRNLKDVANAKRSVGEIYLDRHLRPGIWDGKKLRCPHNYRRSSCRKCIAIYQQDDLKSENPQSTEYETLCEYKQVQAIWRDCDLEELSICKHQRKRSQCPECTDPAFLDSSNIKDGCPSRWSALDNGGITAMLEFDKCKDLLQFYEIPTVESFGASKLSGKLES